MSRARGGAGQASPMLVGALLVSLAFAGLGIDGGRMFTARRDLQNQADAAALAAASALDADAYRASAGEVTQLDPAAARLAAARVLAASSARSDLVVAVEVTPERVTVGLHRPVTTTFLRIVGMHEQQIGATATAAPRTG